MPKRILPLSEQQVRKAKPQAKEAKLFDGKGLFLLITPSGGKLWRFKYQFGGKEKLLAFGSYPEVSLADAREKLAAARKQVAAGIDPSGMKKALKAAQVAASENAFEIVAREWHTRFLNTWTVGHADTILKRLERDVFPWLGDRPISEIEPPDVLAVLRRVESRGALETAHRIKTICGQVFRYAVATGRATRDVAADLKGALPPPPEKHHASITDPKEVAHLIRAIQEYEGGFVVRCALRLAPLFFVRPGELRQAEWSEVNFDEALWTIPAERMKMKAAHTVPLSSQALEILKELHSFSGRGRYLFPCARSVARPMSNNAVNAALRRMGFDKDTMTGHGFRATARTILDEVLNIRPDYIEHQLAHAVKDPNGRAYNRTAHLAERRKMMQVWADYLDDLVAGAREIPLKQRGQE
ncbi:integrase arm-type DNA-binding domain-containing protein [Geomonas sp. Red69]|uniref:tyrosine-type recombinase/integrase n=1 Tax=Geomonas diazotrophica TaxID=2843197 RepID=UPI001C123CC0|nr:integrase arm-type DNA-binding domain-containing protein [Geomonas diazotrophica]MBU5636560.1 integrase arm-type DNA-binding domain-containing protein [Geomonas diazotrophica]